jgi:hypothetical protein
MVAILPTTGIVGRAITVSLGSNKFVKVLIIERGSKEACCSILVTGFGG